MVVPYIPQQPVPDPRQPLGPYGSKMFNPSAPPGGATPNPREPATLTAVTTTFRIFLETTPTTNSPLPFLVFHNKVVGTTDFQGIHFSTNHHSGHHKEEEDHSFPEGMDHHKEDFPEEMDHHQEDFLEATDHHKEEEEDHLFLEAADHHHHSQEEEHHHHQEATITTHLAGGSHHHNGHQVKAPP